MTLPEQTKLHYNIALNNKAWEWIKYFDPRLFERSGSRTGSRFFWITAGSNGSKQVNWIKQSNTSSVEDMFKIKKKKNEKNRNSDRF